MNLLQNKSIRFKILIIPIISTFIAMLAITLAVISNTKTRITEQLEQDGMMIANQATSQIEMSSTAMEIINSTLENDIRNIGTFLNANKSNISNEYLTNIAKQFEVDEINVTDASGKIIYSNLQSSMGQVFNSDHPGYTVLKGEKDQLMENIRKSNETNDYYKYGYVKSNDGGFIQVAILAKKFKSLIML
ncbi:hypothetical protein [Clostridium sp.]|uniref:hypothetical protein n=1 Tax=Clostridium sp. TaxID=1506 RepID=UPI002FC5BB77